MNASHRHDSLDGIINYWNWTKFHGMGASISPVSDRSLLFHSCLAVSLVHQVP
jgi:hypothetical protein